MQATETLGGLGDKRAVAPLIEARKDRLETLPAGPPKLDCALSEVVW